MLSRTSLDRLLNKVDSGSVANDGKIEAVTVCLNSCKLCAWRPDSSEARRRKVSHACHISEWRRRLEWALQQNGEHMKHIFKLKNVVCAVDFS